MSGLYSAIDHELGHLFPLNCSSPLPERLSLAGNPSFQARVSDDSFLSCNGWQSDSLRSFLEYGNTGH